MFDLTLQVDPAPSGRRIGDIVRGSIDIHVSRKLEGIELAVFTGWRVSGGPGDDASEEGPTEVLFQGCWAAGSRHSFPFRVMLEGSTPTYEGSHFEIAWQVCARVNQANGSGSLLGELRPRPRARASVPLRVLGTEDSKGFGNLTSELASKHSSVLSNPGPIGQFEVSLSPNEIHGGDRLRVALAPRSDAVALPARAQLRSYEAWKDSSDREWGPEYEVRKIYETVPVQPSDSGDSSSKAVAFELDVPRSAASIATHSHAAFWLLELLPSEFDDEGAPARRLVWIHGNDTGAVGSDLPVKTSTTGRAQTDGASSLFALVILLVLIACITGGIYAMAIGKPAGLLGIGIGVFGFWKATRPIRDEH